MDLTNWIKKHTVIEELEGKTITTITEYHTNVWYAQSTKETPEVIRDPKKISHEGYKYLIKKESDEVIPACKNIEQNVDYR